MQVLTIVALFLDPLIVVPLLMKARRRHGLIFFYALVASMIAPLLFIGFASNNPIDGAGGGLGTAMVIGGGLLLAMVNLLLGLVVFFIAKRKPQEPEHAQFVGRG